MQFNRNRLSKIFGVTIILSCFGYWGCESGIKNNDAGKEQHWPILSIERSYNTDGQTRGVLKDGDYIYVADGTAGLKVLKVTPGKNLIKAGSLPFANGGVAYSIVKNNDYLYITSRSEGVNVIDVSSPSSPIVVSTITTPDDASFLFLDHNLLYISAKNYLLVVDISDPKDPKTIGQVEGTSPNQHLVVENGIAFIAAYNGGLRLVDVTTPSSPVILSEKKLGYNVWAIAKKGNYIFLGGGSSGLLVYKITDPLNPYFVMRLTFADGTEPGSTDKPPFDMTIWGDFLIIADGNNGVRVVDINNPGSPFTVEPMDTPGYCRGLSINDNTIAVADYYGGVHLLSIFATTDLDKDGVMDGADVFPEDPSEWNDTDGDGIGNNTDNNDDNDSVLDIEDAFPHDLSEWLDSDNDGVGNNSDVFPSDSSEWADADLDGIGDNADLDDDNDGIIDSNDKYPYDPLNIVRITDNSTSTGNGFPKLDGNKLVWRGYMSNGKAAIFYEDLATSEGNILTEGISGFIGVPSISNGQVAWRVWDSIDRFYIYLWDGNETKIVTDYPAGKFIMPWGYPPSYHSVEVSLDNGKISWAGWDGNDYEIFLWDGENIRQITDNLVDDYEPQLNNGQISWTATLENGVFDVFFWDGSSIRNISNRANSPDEDSHLMNGMIAWSGYTNSEYKRDIYIWDGDKIVAINLPGDDYEPQIDDSGSFVTWHNRINGQYDIYVWDGYQIVPIATSPNYDEAVPYANGGKIVFSKDNDNGTDIYIADYRVNNGDDDIGNRKLGY